MLPPMTSHLVCSILNGEVDIVAVDFSFRILFINPPKFNCLIYCFCALHGVKLNFFVEGFLLL